MMIANQIKHHLQKALEELKLPKTKIHLEHPAIETHGDYSTNVALTTFSDLPNLPKSPKLLAKTITKLLQLNKELNKIVAKIWVADPGFINFYLQPSVLLNELKTIVKQKTKYGSSNWGKGKTVVIDYSAPNIAKRFTVGHLRSTVIGQAIYNIYQFLGFKCIGDNHLGDWGTQFGKMIVAINKWADKPIEKLTIDEMERLYVRFHQEAKNNSDLDDLARQAFKNLELGRKKEKEIWKKLVDKSIAEFEKIYHLLRVKIDEAYGESYYETIMKEVISTAKNKKVATKSQGASVIKYPKNSLPPSMLLKNDGATTYFTRDLATIKFRRDQWNPDLMIYEVGAEQSLHFKQLFWAAELLGWGTRNQYTHIPHGLIRLKEGKMSTRKGNIIKLEQVLAEAVSRAQKLNSDPEIARSVGIGAVKYNDLKHSPTTGYAFDWNEVLSMEGNSGPYLQYTHARAHSVLSKSPNLPKSLNLPKSPNPEELAILRWIYRFPEVVQEAAQSYSPNLICNFLFELARAFNTFYNRHRILDAKSDDQKQLRLTLTAAVAQVLHNGLQLLGIQAPEKM